MSTSRKEAVPSLIANPPLGLSPRPAAALLPMVPVELRFSSPWASVLVVAVLARRLAASAHSAGDDSVSLSRAAACSAPRFAVCGVSVEGKVLSAAAAW